MPDETPAPEPAPVLDAAPTPEPVAGLTAADVERLVADRIEAERQAAAQQETVQATFSEAEALSDDYKSAAGKAYLFAVAQESGTDLSGAHDIITQMKEQAAEQAIAEYREGLRSGTHPPRLPAGDPTAPSSQGEPKTLKEARARMEERFRATYGN